MRDSRDGGRDDSRDYRSFASGSRRESWTSTRPGGDDRDRGGVRRGYSSSGKLAGCLYSDLMNSH